MSLNINLDVKEDKDQFIIDLLKAIQSGNLNFLIGAGCSSPSIKVAGNIESEVQRLLKANKKDEADKKLFDFFKPILESTIKTKTSSDIDYKTTLDNYETFLENIIRLLFERKSNILSKQATIFTTNYDLFVERASEKYQGLVKLNDGFNRSPIFDNKFAFSSTEFFNSTYNNGNLYNYQVPIPSINLVKLHGSLSWKVDSKKIVSSSITRIKTLKNLYDKTAINKTPNLIKKFLKQLLLILPIKDKFRETILDEVYYDLLRIYANQLDKENTLLIAEGFSFEDEHILGITKRALVNPTLKLVIFCHEKKKLNVYSEMFNNFNNVDIVYLSKDKLSFHVFNDIIKEVNRKDIELFNVSEKDNE